MKNADEGELRAIASVSEDTHVYNVADFHLMADIVDVLTRTICERMETLHKQIAGLSSSHVTWPSGHVRGKSLDSITEVSLSFCPSCRQSGLRPPSGCRLASQ